MSGYVLAYLDPTTGSIGYQIALSAVLAAGAAVRMYWKKLRKLFRGGGSDSSADKQRQESAIK